MRHKYNIPDLLTSIIGHRGLPFPGSFLPSRSRTGKREEYELSPEASTREEYVKGTRLYAKDSLGRWYFMPVSLKHPSIQSENNMFELDYAVISVTGKKNIIETPLTGRKGSVKELISMGDYKISIAAFIQGENGKYPEEKITRLRDIININETIELISAFTDLLLDLEDKVVITDFSFPSTPGVEDGQAVKIELVTDRAFELTLQ
ncbi:hypothetical protein DMB45_00240 [Sanguibacteroides justesenii]|uniref:DUF6046 domain-containing protein n=1 Tax=Sanguibacteroides justesenii TaxID=1547597 RepID=UPI000D88215D|nr:DUF6046 domain-containing protein [Sanguibacteroides justesenii]PXZ44912.1 hypothetical protein DMB45_00240 [Sanguibacteroides justesenii]